jgi:hypothetical protein
MTKMARLIASEISINCQRHLSGEIDRSAWDAEQQRLWTLAAHERCAADVMSLVAPSIIQHHQETHA